MAESTAQSQGAELTRPCSTHAVARFVNVVAPHLDDAYSLARWLTGTKADADDVVQEASLRALRAIDDFADASARAWLLKIVRNTTYDWLRKNRAGPVVFVDDVADVEYLNRCEFDSLTPEGAMIQSEQTTLLESAIYALPTHFREALVLRELQALSYRDIAELTGTSIGTTMSRLYRARRLVSAHLKGRIESDSSTTAPAQH